MGIVEDKVPRIPLGSGEGLAKNFGFSMRDKDTGSHSLVRTAESVIVTIAEIDTFRALSDRSGSTLSPELRKLYSGEELGFGYADLSKRVIIPGGSYRSVVVAGVQPGKGETILGDPDGGFPQRWLWLPAYDPAAPDTEPSEPSVWDWSPPGSAGSSSGEIVVMKVAVGIRREIKEDRRARLRGDAADMEAHALYTRLKVAAALSLLSGTDRVSLSDWELAGLVMSVSSRVRAKVEGMLSKKAAAENVARGRQEGVRAAVAAESAASASLVRVGRNVMKLMLPRGEWMSEAAMRRKISAADRVLLKEVLAWLVERGSLEERAHVYQGQKGLQYRKAGR
jgi:hypothetical protein